MPELETCAWCPRLCRHVCPVAVATGWESATPTALATTLWLHGRGRAGDDAVHLATDLCLGCGACEAHCKHHAPVPAWLRAARPAPAIEPLAPIEGEGVVTILLGDEPAPPTGAWLRTGDAFGHAAWAAGETTHLPRLAAHLAGRRVRVRHGDVAAIVEAAGVRFERVAPPPAPARYVTCFEGPAPGPGQLACCGRREGFADRDPDAAHLVAAANVARMGDTPHACTDAACAGWLRAHGATLLGPDDAPPAEPLR